MATTAPIRPVRPFGSFAQDNGPGEASAPRQKAKFWLNVGFIQHRQGENGEDESYFVSVAGLGGQDGKSNMGGIPLDTMNDFPLTGTADMQKLRKQQNELRARLVSAAETMQPGEARIVATDPNTNLSIELRRVGEEADAASIDTGECPVNLGF